MKKLATPSGHISSDKNDSSIEGKLVKLALLVHSGPNGEKITFMSADGEISFDEDRIKTIIKNHNKKINELAAGYGGIDKMPVGAFPPILDQHENDSNNRIIGRLSHLLTFDKRDIPGVGNDVACIVSEITFLGKETIDRVSDGRIYYLSIGIDEDTNTLEEVSTVIAPAAPGAMLLSKYKRNTIGESQMNKKLLQAKANRLAKLMAIKENISAMSGKIVSANNRIKNTCKEGDVTHRLTSLMRSGKLTPAEYKKMDVKKLAALDANSLETVISTIDAMESKVIPGQRGSIDSMDFSTIAKAMNQKNLRKLKSEVMGDFKRLGKKLAFGDESDEDKEHGDTKQMAEEVHPGRDPHAVPGEGGDEQQLKHLSAWHAKHLEHHHTMKKHLESGDIEKAKEHHVEMVKHCMEAHKYLGHHGSMESASDESSVKHMEIGDVKSEDYKKSMDYLQQQIDELNTQLARISGSVEELINVEKEEGEEFGKEAESHSKLSGEVEGDFGKKDKTKEGEIPATK